MGLPFDEEEERKKNLVRDYLAKKYNAGMGTANDNVKSARTRDDMLDMANTAGRALTEIGNSNRSPSVLYNSFDRLGDAPKVISPEDRKWDDSHLSSIGKKGVDRAEKERDAVYDNIREEQSVKGWDRENENAERDDAFEGDRQGQQRKKWERENKNAPLEDQFSEDQRGYKRYEMDHQKKLNAFDDQEIDPASPVSQRVGVLYKNVLLSKAAEAGRAGDSAAAGKLKEMAKNPGMSAREQYDSLKMMGHMDWRDIILSNDRQKALSQRVAKDKGEGGADPKMIQKASEKLASHQHMEANFQAVDDALGAPLESYQVKNGKLLDGKGKTVDLPGVSLPGIGRVSGYSNKARSLQAAAAAVFNSTLKDRSGTAVSDSELERLKTEFQSGRMNSEADLIRGMQQYKRAARDAMRNAEAGYSPEVLDAYRQHGGKTLQDYEKSKNPGKPGGTPAKEGKDYDGFDVWVPKYESGPGKRKRIKDASQL